MRFGPKLRVHKDIGPDTLDIIVPSMILQPLVENSIKHGLSRKVGARLDHDPQPSRARAAPSSRSRTTAWASCWTGSTQPMSSGIGLANVRERLRVIYGATYQLTLDSEPGEGTRARIEVPELVAPEQITA